MDEAAVLILQRSTTGGQAEFGISGEEYLELWNRASWGDISGGYYSYRTSGDCDEKKPSSVVGWRPSLEAGRLSAA